MVCFYERKRPNQLVFQWKGHLDTAFLEFGFGSKMIAVVKMTQTFTTWMENTLFRQRFLSKMGRNSLFFAKMDAKITFLFRSLISVVINLVSKSEISTGLEFFEKKNKKKFSKFLTFFLRLCFVDQIQLWFVCLYLWQMCTTLPWKRFEAKTDRRLYKWGA